MSTPSPAPEQRFSDRVDNYIRYRPSYPVAMLERLEKEAGLNPASVIADIGSGTGISTAMFLQAGYMVQAVEPNREMREAAERLLSDRPGFRSVAGSAQATTLPDHSVDMIVAAQAFHWFNTSETREEFSRILKPGGHIALIWNERKLDTTPFLRDYEQLLMTYGTDYAEVRHENIGQTALDGFFIGPYARFDFENEQRFDFEGIQGRLLSSSYAPPEGHPNHRPMLEKLREIFNTHQEFNETSIQYSTQLYLGK